MWAAVQVVLVVVGVALLIAGAGLLTARLDLARRKRISRLATRHDWRKPQPSVLVARDAEADGRPGARPGLAGLPIRPGRDLFLRPDESTGGRYRDKSIEIGGLVSYSSVDVEDRRHCWIACVDELSAGTPILEVVRRRHTVDVSSVAGREFRLGVAAFDGRHRVTTTSPEFARLVLSPEVVSMLMSWPADFRWRIEGGRILAWGPGRLRARQVEPTLDRLTALAAAVPESARNGRFDTE